MNREGAKSTKESGEYENELLSRSSRPSRLRGSKRE